MINVALFILVFIIIDVRTASVPIGNFANARLKIVGGDEAVPHAYPYQVALIIDNSQLCGGSLISQNYVLTAAHCASEMYERNVDIILGAHNVSSNESTQVRRKPSKITINKNFNYTSLQNDIALIKLNQPAPINAFIKPIELISRTEANNTLDGQTATSTGWGLTKDVKYPNIKDMSDVLMVVEVPILLLKSCRKYYKDQHIQFVTSKNICTDGTNKKGTCNGDSGGPLVYDGKLIGVVSGGANLCEIEAPSVFTNVGRYLNWIEKHSDVST
ncbi:unnamed protein product [Phyllotreta striolata]|uniref:Peptidase S1 domain-containing protein n=1 Tax=Phyllotreta striolata TaxID=444603 RepID=A0A9N9THS3_PHYSR|nr:unnamed protein product [Phyllotreta striolata]